MTQAILSYRYCAFGDADFTARYIAYGGVLFCVRHMRFKAGACAPRYSRYKAVALAGRYNGLVRGFPNAIISIILVFACNQVQFI